MREMTTPDGKLAGLASAIEAIAFQTSLMALNAAVDAASSGRAPSCKHGQAACETLALVEGSLAHTSGAGTLAAPVSRIKWTANRTGSGEPADGVETVRRHRRPR